MTSFLIVLFCFVVVYVAALSVKALLYFSVDYDDKWWGGFPLFLLGILVTTLPSLAVIFYSLTIAFP